MSKSAAAVHFSPSSWPIAGPWAFESGKNRPRWGRLSLSTSQVRQAARPLHCLRLLLAVWLALWSLASPAQTLEIIELRNRPAEQLLPVLQPLVAGGGSISGTGFQLIVRTTPANLAQLRQVIASLDRAQRQLLISVRQDFGGVARSGGVGGQIVLAPGASGARGSVFERTGTAQDNVSQQLRVQEGNQAYISTGESTLVQQRTVTRTVNGVIVSESALPRDFNTGFYVTPRVNGDTVFLEIGAQRDTRADLGPGSANTNRVVSTISGRLGEWIELGGVNQSQSAETRGLLSRSSDAGAQERRVHVRVEEVR